MPSPGTGPQSLTRDPAYIPWFEDDGTRQPSDVRFQPNRQRAASKRFQVAPSDAVFRLKGLIENNRDLIETIQEQDESWNDVKAIDLHKDSFRVYFKTRAACNQFNSLNTPLRYTRIGSVVNFTLEKWHRNFAYFRITNCAIMDSWITEIHKKKNGWATENGVVINFVFISRSQMYWKIAAADDAKKLLREPEVVLDGHIGTAE